MSYISAIKVKDNIVVWERNENGRVVKTYPAPYFFYVQDDDGEFVSMYGDKLARYDFNTGAEFKAAVDDHKRSGIKMFESDIPSELRLLSEQYYNVPAPKMNTTFLDIEVDYDKTIGYSSIKNPYAPINSIALYHSHTKQYVILAVPPNLAPNKANDDKWIAGDAPQSFIDTMEDIAPYMDDIKLSVKFCKDEKELLIDMLAELEDTDIMSGWNSDLFDIPYIGKRLEKIGKKYFNKLSFDLGRKPAWRTVEVFGEEVQILDPCGRISADYMVLFKKYEMAERPTYKLEAIADEFLPDLPKLEYDGTLADLYRDDFAYFVRYNIRDTEILQGFEDQLGYVELANQMMHMSTGLWKHVGGTLKLAELAMINYCHHELDGTVVNDVDVPEDSGQIQGALVLLPQIGLHENVSSVDLASLYPSAIRSLNISPETIIGQLRALTYEQLPQDLIAQVEAFTAKGATVEAAMMAKKSRQEYAAELVASNSDIEIEFTSEYGETIVGAASKFRKLFIAQGWACSGYGTIFDQNKQGIIPQILSNWYTLRVEYKKKLAKSKDADDNKMAMYYDKLQYVYKIKLNSFYGALANKYFRFFDLRMGESTTGTGRHVLVHQCAETCKVLDGEYKLPNIVKYQFEMKKGIPKHRWNYGYSKDWSIAYGDTDSTYFNTNVDNIDDATFVGDSTAELVNNSWPKFMRDTFLCADGFDDIMQCEREVVSDRGIFVDKKRYILHLVDLDGWKCDKLKVMGLDTKKTTLPRAIANSINTFVERFLRGEDWEIIEKDIVDFKDMLMETDDIMSIGLPKGVKGVEDYTDRYNRDNTCTIPGHVSASIMYNACLDTFNDKESMRIMSGMKIKIFYITKPIGRFKSIAIPVDIEKVPQWFYDKFEVDRDAHVERLVDKPLGNIIKAIDKESPSRQSLLNNELLCF